MKALGPKVGLLDANGKTDSNPEGHNDQKKSDLLS